MTQRAAAAIATEAVREGVANADSAKKAVEPLVGRPIFAVANVTNIPELTNAKPGKEIQIKGQSFNAIMKLTTR